MTQEYQLETTITPTNSSSTARTFLPPELYLPEWARDTEFFRCMTILLDYIQNSLKDTSNPKYAMIEQAYKDINFKYKDILQTSEECLKAMLTENGFGQILEIFKVSLEQLQMLALYLPLLKIMKGTDEGYRLFLSLFASDFEIETWLDNPQELEEYTFNILFISWVNVGLSSNFVNDFIKFSRTYVYPILKNVEMQLTYKYLSPFIYSYPRLKIDITTNFNEEAVLDWTTAVQNSNLGSNYWEAVTYGNNKFVALSQTGYISTSTNGTDWAVATRNTNLGSNNWSSLVYDGTKFVALSYDGYVSTSTNGTDWTVATRDTNLDRHGWSSLVYDGTKFVALDSSGYISTSTNGTDWTVATRNTNLDSHGWSSLVYDGTKFVALSNIDYISTSTNGTDWTVATRNTNLGLHYWRAVTYGNNKFIALSQTGYISTSTNGTDWAVATQDTNLGSNNWSSLVYDGTKFVALGTHGFISKYEAKIK